MAILDSFTWILESDSSKLKTDIEDSKKKVDSLGSAFNQAEQAGVSATEGIGVGLGKLIGVIASVASVAKLFNMAEQFAEGTIALDNLSKQTGIAVGDLDGLQKGLQRVGVDSANTAQALTGITNAIGSESDALEKAGIAVKDSQGNLRNTLDVFGDIAEVSSKMDSQKASAFFKSLKITDPQLINTLREGRGEIENLIRAEKLKGVADEEQVKLARDYKKVSDELSLALGDIGDAISTFILPIYTKLKAGVLAGIEVLSKHSGFLKIFAGILTAVATPALLSFASAQLAAIAPFVLAGAAIAALALVLDDLMNFFEGNGSVIEDWAKQFGATQEEIDKFRETVKGYFISLFEYWDDLMEAFADAPDKVSSIMSSVSNTFRDNFNDIKEFIGSIVKWILDKINLLGAGISGIVKGAKSIGGMIGNLFGSNESTSTSSAPVQEAAEMMNSARNAPTNTISNSSIQNSKSSSQTNNQTNNITINSTADPKAIADKVKTSTKDGLSEFARQNRGGSLN